jgi:hypothetical protein
MKKSDREHLRFILRSSDSQFDAWANTASIEEIENTMELIRRARIDLDIEEDKIFGVEEMDLSESKALIERIMNVGKI